MIDFLDIWDQFGGAGGAPFQSGTGLNNDVGPLPLSGEMGETARLVGIPPSMSTEHVCFHLKSGVIASRWDLIRLMQVGEDLYWAALTTEAQVSDLQSAVLNSALVLTCSGLLWCQHADVSGPHYIPVAVRESSTRLVMEHMVCTHDNLPVTLEPLFPLQKANEYVHPEVSTGILVQPFWHTPPPQPWRCPCSVPAGWVPCRAMAGWCSYWNGPEITVRPRHCPAQALPGFGLLAVWEGGVPCYLIKDRPDRVSH